MENRNSRNPCTRTPFELVSTRFLFASAIFVSFRKLASRKPKPQFRRNPSFDLRISLFGLFLLGGCGAPGEPTPPSPPVPVAITDLSARQAGDGVQLTFTTPAKTTSGDRLTEPPSIEVLRGALKPDGSPDAKSFRIVYTIPSSLVNSYRTAEQTQFTDPVAPAETRAHPGATLAYRVRTRASKKRASLDSNTVTVRVFPVPQRIASLQAKLTETSIELTWTLPTQSSAGDPLSAAPTFHIYRGELDPRAHDPAAKDLSHDKWIFPLALLARSDTTSYRDTQFDFGKTYVYVVRSATTAEGNALESDDSDPPLVLAAVDTFPPSVPQGVVAAVTSASPTSPPEVDLSWSINSETDLAGYRVYRSEQQDDKGQLVTPDLLPSPAYRDMSVRPEHQYWYRVTSVDHSGNESAPSPPVAADVTQHSS
jgi:hypothetical protein